MAYDAGEAFIRLVPSFAGVVERIDREMARAGVSGGRAFSRNFNQTVRRETNNAPLGPSREQATRQGEQTGRTFADSFKARVTAALRSLPDIEINADSTEAEVRIARLRTNLEQLRDQRVGVDIDAATALATVENLRRQIEEVGAASPDVAVRIDTARASAELARIQAQVEELRGEDPEVDVHVDDHGTVGRTTAEVNLLHAALIALAPAAIPIGAALTAGLAGALGVLGAVIAGIGVLTLGISGVGKTIDLLNKRSQTAGGGSGGTGGVDAAYQIQKARQSLADTERRIARQSVQDARAVAKAERDLTDAEQSLHIARQQAIRDLQDLANAQVDANLGQRQAEIDLANAQEELQRINHDWTATEEQRQQARLDVAKAQQALIEAREKSTRATQDNAKAQKAGVDGAPAVVAATRKQQDAVEALHQARQKQRQDAADGAREIARAEQDLAHTMQQTGAAGANSLAKIDQQLAKTNPAVLAFAKFWRRTMSPVIADLKGAAAGALLPSIERGLKIMQPLFGPLEAFIRRIGRALGGLFVDMAKAFNSPFWTQFFAFLGRNLPKWLTEFGHVIGNIATGLAGLFQAFGPLISRMGRGLVELTSRFADWGKHAGRNSAVQSFLRYLRESGPLVISFFGHLFGAVGKLIQGLAPLGRVMLIVLDRFAAFLAKLSPNQLLLFIGAVAGLVAVFGGPFLAIVIALTAGAALLAANWDKLKGAIMPVVQVLVGIARKAFEGIRNAVHTVSEAIGDHRKELGQLLHAFKVIAGFLIRDVLPILGDLAKVFFELAGRYIAFVITQVAFLVDAVDGLVRAAKAVGRWFAGPFVDFFTGAWDKITGAFSDAWNWVKVTWSKLWNGAKDIITAPVAAASKLVHAEWGAIRDAYRFAWYWVRDTFASLWQKTTDLITAPISAAKRALGGIWGDIKTGASRFVDGIGGIWNRLERVFKAPVRFIVETVIDGALIAAWNWIAKKIHFGQIDPVKLPDGFAAGGVYPGYTPGRDIGYIGVSGGEAIMRPEWTRAVGSDYVHAANAAARGGGEHGVRRFLGGFDVGGVVKGIIGGANPLTYINYIKDKIAGPLHDLVAKFGDTDWVRMLEHVPTALAGNLYDAIREKLKDLGKGIIGRLPGVHPVIGGHGSNIQVRGHGGTPTQNFILGETIARAIWPDRANGVALDQLWTRESGWSQFADTRVSGLDPANASVYAYGIAQARPASKYPRAGQPADLGGASDPRAQINWGLGYIRDRYGDPSSAWDHELKYGWYDRGGSLEPGFTLAYNGTGQAEIVAPRQALEQLAGQGQVLRAVGELVIRRDSLGELGAYVDTRISDAGGFHGGMQRTHS